MADITQCTHHSLPGLQNVRNLGGNDQKKEDENEELTGREDVEEIEPKAGFNSLVVINAFHGDLFRFVLFCLLTNT